MGKIEINISMIKDTPNDMELGKKVRAMMNNIEALKDSLDDAKKKWNMTDKG